MGADQLEPARTGAATAQATIPQEFFWSMAAQDPDPSAYFVTTSFVIEGALDAERLARAMRTLVAAHEVFRTGFRQVDGQLQQVVIPLDQAPAFELEIVDRSPLPDAEWNAAIKATIGELVGRGFDLERGRLLWARLIKVAPERHALVAVFHHIVIDATSNLTFFRRLFDLYTAAADGELAPEQPALQYVDVAQAFARWSSTPTGQAQVKYWRDRLRDAPATELPVDIPRAPVDARRSAAVGGIGIDPMYPVEYVKLAPELREAVTRIAREQRVTIYGVYLASLLWLLHRRTGQTDLCVETTADMRPEHPAFGDVQGVMVFWTMLRVDVAGCESVGDVLPRAGAAVAEAKQNRWIQDYYRVVPHALRRVVLNYVPLRWFAPKPKTYPGLRIEQRPQPFPPWRRPWDLHLTIIDGDDAVLVWTGNTQLFRKETVSGLLRGYLEILEGAAAATASR